MQRVIDFLINHPALPMSAERPCTRPSKSEVKRWCKSKSVLLNDVAVEGEEWLFCDVVSLVFFPKGKRKTTVW